MIDLTKLPFIQAAPNTFQVKNGRTIQQIIIHTSEAPQKPGSAKAVAEYFHNGSEGRPASAHYSVDAGEIYHCVQNKDVAFGAPGANINGLHIEHAGNATESAAEWADSYNTQMLARSAELTATLCSIYDIPVRWLTPAQVAAKETGIAGHHEVTLAYPKLHGSHVDPGPNFPKNHYLELVAKALASHAEDALPSNRNLQLPDDVASGDLGRNAVVNTRSLPALQGVDV